jgi:hypothetical protein
MGSRLEDLSVQILQGLLAGRRASLSSDEAKQAECYVKSAVQLAQLLIDECEKVEIARLEQEMGYKLPLPKRYGGLRNNGNV